MKWGPQGVCYKKSMALPRTTSNFLLHVLMCMKKYKENAGLVRCWTSYMSHFAYYRRLTYSPFADKDSSFELFLEVIESYFTSLMRSRSGKSCCRIFVFFTCCKLQSQIFNLAKLYFGTLLSKPFICVKHLWASQNVVTVSFHMWMNSVDSKILFNIKKLNLFLISISVMFKNCDAYDTMDSLHIQ